MNSTQPAVPILIVEDNEDMREVLRAVLTRAGFATMEAENGREALRKIRDVRHPWLILLDLMMPIMDGEEFRRLQLSDPLLSSIPVVICSGADACPQIAKRLGARGCLEKPFDFKKLIELVKTVEAEQHP